MIMPNIANLRRENWVKCTDEQRLEALNQLEGYIAGQEGRAPCPVSSNWLEPRTRGVHQYFNDGRESIELNTSLLASDEPYQAVETLLHEGRHSYQHHVVNHPELAENEQQLRDWTMSQEGGYIQPDGLNNSLYASQPTEVDARAIARSRMDSLYGSELKDEYYQGYKAQKEQEAADIVEEAKQDLGEDYEQVAREAVQEQYQQRQEAQEAQSLATSPYLGTNSKSENSQIETNPMNPSLDNGGNPAPSPEKPLSYETYNQLRDDDLNYFEQLRDHAELMRQKGYMDIADEDQAEMQRTVERLGKLQKERDQIYNLNGKPRGADPSQENPTEQIDNRSDQTLDLGEPESIAHAAETSPVDAVNPPEDLTQEVISNTNQEGNTIPSAPDESQTGEDLGENALEQNAASNLEETTETPLEAASPEISAETEALSQTTNANISEPQPEVNSDTDPGAEAEDETYRYGLGF